MPKVSKDSQQNVRKVFLSLIGFVTFTILLLVPLQFFLWHTSNKVGIRAHCGLIEALIEENRSHWGKLFSTSFDMAVACKTEACKKDLINQTLLSLQNTDTPKFFQTSYFIRLNADGNIEKWFRSGEVITTIPSTRGEKKVVQLLRGKTSPICTQNWKLDSQITTMRYLRDDYSEAETIIPIKNGDKTLGAIVSRFGD